MNMVVFRGDVARVLAGTARGERFCLPPRSRRTAFSQRLLKLEDRTDSFCGQASPATTLHGLEVGDFRRGDMSWGHDATKLHFPFSSWGFSVLASVCSKLNPARSACVQQQIRACTSMPELPPQVVRVPNLGDSITEGTVVEWRHGVGDFVAADEVLCVLETDKVSVEIHANTPGKLLSIAVDVGGTAFVGGDLALIEPLDAGNDSSHLLDSQESKQDEEGQSSKGPSAADGTKRPSSQQAGGEVTSRRRVPLISFGRSNRRNSRTLHTEGADVKNKKDADTRESQLSSLPSSPSEAAVPVVSRPGTGHSSLVLKYASLEQLPSFLQRPALSDFEIEIINCGTQGVEGEAWISQVAFSLDPRRLSPSAKGASKK